MHEADENRVLFPLWKWSIPFTLTGIAICFSFGYWLSFTIIIAISGVLANKLDDIYVVDSDGSFVHWSRSKSPAYRQYQLISGSLSFFPLFIIISLNLIWPIFCSGDPVQVSQKDLSHVYQEHLPACTLVTSGQKVLLGKPLVTERGTSWWPVCIGTGTELQHSRLSWHLFARDANYNAEAANYFLRYMQRFPHDGVVIYYGTGRLDVQYQLARLISFKAGFGYGGLTMILPPVRWLSHDLLVFIGALSLFEILLLWTLKTIPGAQSNWTEPLHPKLADVLVYSTLDDYADNQIQFQIKEFKASNQFSTKNARKKYWKQTQDWMKKVLLTKLIRPLPGRLQDIMRHKFFG